MTAILAPPIERNRDLVRELLIRHVRIRYRRSVLGLAWSQLAPIATIVILSVVFMRVIPLGIENYPVFLFAGLTSWQWFQSGISSATTSVTTNRDLVRHAGFPVLLLPVVEIGSQFIHYALALPVLLGAVVLTTGRLPVAAVSLPLILFVQFLLCLGPGYLLATAHVPVRDTSQVVSVVLRLLFYATPIMYDEGRLLGTRLQFLFDFNPIARLITAQRDALLFGRWPDATTLVVIGAIGGALTVSGIRVFRAAAPAFPDEV